MWRACKNGLGLPCHWPGKKQQSGLAGPFYEGLGILKGDVPARRWDSLTIIWHGEAETWAPGDDVTPI